MGKRDKLDKSHVTRVSLESSLYDEICVNCGYTDDATKGWGNLAKPCPKPVGKGGITIKEWYKKDKERRAMQK